MPGGFSQRTNYGLPFKPSVGGVRKSWVCEGPSGRHVVVLAPIPYDRHHNNWALFVPSTEQYEVFLGEEAEDHAFFGAVKIAQQESKKPNR